MQSQVVLIKQIILIPTIEIMNLYKINLNLLVAFDALMTTKHVSRAADKCCISQSAMSTALNQCRTLFNDELLIRVASGMVPTPKALSLIEPVREVITKANALFETANDFNPLTHAMTVRLGLSDYACAIFLPTIMQHFHEHAPGFQFKIRPITNKTDLSELDQDNIDLAIGFFVSVPEKYYHQALFDEEAVCVGARTNPLFASPMSLSAWSSATHINTLQQHDDGQSALDRYLAETNLPKRNVLLTVPYAHTALELIQNTPYVTNTSKRLFNKYQEPYQLTSSPLPFALPRLPIYQIWHKQYHKSVPHQWFRQQIKAILGT